MARAAAAGTASGTASAKLSFSGQALRPRTLVTGLEGSGTLTLAAADISGFSPVAVQGVVAAAFAKEFAIGEATLVAALKGGLGKGGLTLGPRQINIELGDGALKLERFNVATPQGRVETLVTVDLANLDAESEWRITAVNQEAGRPDWPRISVFYTGALARLAAIEPRIVLGSFERELTVRRMEREVEELERLRRLDEERAKAERERLRAAEAERQRQIEAERQRRLELRQQQQQLRQAPSAPAAAAPGGPGAMPAVPAAGDAPSAAPAAVTQPHAAAPPTAAPQPAPVEAWKPASVTSEAPLPVAPASPAASQPPPRPRPARPPSNPSAADTLLKSLGTPN